MNAPARFVGEGALLQRARDAERRCSELEAENARLRAAAARHAALFHDADPLSAIIIAVCEHFGVPRADLLAHCRIAEHVTARHIVMYLAVEMTGLSLTSIGRRLRHDRATTRHGRERINKMIARCEPIAADIAAIRRRVTERGEAPARLKAGRAAA